VTRRRKVGIGLVTLVLGCAGACGIAAQGTALPTSPAPIFDLDAVRNLVENDQDLPTSVHGVRVATSGFPRSFVMAGAGPSWQEMGIYVWKVDYGERHLVVDAANDRATQEGMVPWATFSDAGWQTSQSWIATADHILFTHEHFDHCAGLTNSEHFDAVADAVFMPAAQLNNDFEMKRSGFTEEKRAQLTPVPLLEPMHLDQGVVVIPAPGHTPGSLLVYVRLSNRKELLFIGDVVWVDDLIAERRTRSRGVNWGLGSDRHALAGQIAFLADLRRDHPEIRQLVAHDIGQIDALREEGWIQLP
jgi:glyoxylase-like metal-dependent hydrolase (beta-lactamase superfamily II)